MDVIGVDHVIVVKDEDDLVRRRAELIHERGEDQLDRRWLRLPQQRERVAPTPGATVCRAAIT